MKKFVLIFFIITFSSLFTHDVYSQAICPIYTLKVNKVTGKIVSKFNKDDVLPGLKIELRKADDEETLAATATTDKKGLFEFKGIRKAKYILIVYFDFTGNLELKYRAVVKVKRSNSSKSSPSILIRFGLDCWETEALTVK